MKDKKGFTLIELLVVIVIIGLLFSFIIWEIEDVRNRSTPKTNCESYYNLNC